MSTNNEVEHWQTRVQTVAEAVGHMYENEDGADILFVVGKNAEVCVFCLDKTTI